MHNTKARPAHVPVNYTKKIFIFSHFSYYSTNFYLLWNMKRQKKEHYLEE